MSRRLALALATAAALGALPAAAHAVPTADGEFAVSEKPGRLTLGPDGNVWVVLDGQKLARVTPAGVVTEFNPPDIGQVTDITAGPDGRLWVTDGQGIGRFLPADPEGTDEIFADADAANGQGITAGPNNTIWVTSPAGEKIIRFNAANPADKLAIAIPDVGALGFQGRGITVGGDGNLWALDSGAKRLVKVTPGGTATFTPINPNGGAQEIAAGPGVQLAFTDPVANPQEVNRFAEGSPIQTTLTPGADPFGIVYASDGAYWIGNFAGASLGRLTPDGAYSALPLTPGSGPRYLTVGAGNTLWASLELTNRIARVTGVEPPAPPAPPTPPTPSVGPPNVVPPPLVPGFGRTTGVSAAVSRAGVRATPLGYLTLTVRNVNGFAVRGVATLRATVPVARRGARRPRLRTVVLGTPRSFTVGARRSRPVRFRLTPSQRAYLRRVRAWRARLTVVVRSPAGDRRTIARSVLIRAPLRVSRR